MMRRIIICGLFFVLAGMGESVVWGAENPYQNFINRCNDGVQNEFIVVSGRSVPRGFSYQGLRIEGCFVGGGGGGAYIKELNKYSTGYGLYAIWYLDEGVEFCDTVPAEYKEVMGCPTEPISDPENACKYYSEIVGIPYNAASCNFHFKENVSCYDGEGNYAGSSYDVVHTDSGKSGTANFEGNEGVVCHTYSPCIGCDWESVDLSAPPGADSNRPPLNSDSCIKEVNGTFVNICDSNHKPNDGASSNPDCIKQLPNGDYSLDECYSSGGGGDGGGGTPGTGGGGDGGGGGTPGTGGVGDGGGDDGGSTPGGSGTGGGPSGSGSSDTGEDEGFDGNFGDSSDAENAVNQGGWGDGKGDYTLDRGQGEHKNYLDGLMDKGPVQNIKNHDYVQTSGAACSLNVVLFNRNFTFSLCEYQDKIRLFGQLIFSVAGLCGILLVLRR